MSEESNQSTDKMQELFDIGSLFRSSATITFVIQIVSVIIMIGSLATFYAERLLPSLDPDLLVLVLLVGSIVTLMIFLIALSVFIRFSRRISDAVIGPGIQNVRMDSPRVKTVVYIYALLVALMAITGIYLWYLIYKNYLSPWIAVTGSASLTVFSIALGAFFIALLIQLIVAGVGRSATKVIIQVLDTDDSEFLR